MFRLVIFLLSVCFLSFGNPLELKSLCNERITRDGVHKVNSYYRLKLTENLSPIGDYLPEAIPNQILPFNSYEKYFYPEFKKQIKEIYSEEFMNSSQLPVRIREKQRQFEYLKGGFLSRFGKGDMPSSLSYNFIDIENLLSKIAKLSETNNLTWDFLPYEQLRGNLTLLAKEGLDENQKSTFRDEFIYVFYEKPLAKFDGFKLYRGNQSTFYNRSNYGVICWSLYLPFHDLNHLPNTKNCSSTDSLPKFYSLETIPVDLFLC